MYSHQFDKEVEQCHTRPCMEGVGKRNRKWLLKVFIKGLSVDNFVFRDKTLLEVMEVPLENTSL